MRELHHGHWLKERTIKYDKMAEMLNYHDT